MFSVPRTRIDTYSNITPIQSSHSPPLIEKSNKTSSISIFTDRLFLILTSTGATKGREVPPIPTDQKPASLAFDLPTSLMPLSFQIASYYLVGKVYEQQLFGTRGGGYPTFRFGGVLVRWVFRGWTMRLEGCVSCMLYVRNQIGKSVIGCES